MTDFIESTFRLLFVLAMQTEEHRALSNLILKIIFFSKTEKYFSFTAWDDDD